MASRPAEVRQRPEPAARHGRADHHDRRLRCEDAAQRAERAAAGDVDQQVVPLAEPREVLSPCSRRPGRRRASATSSTLAVLHTAVTSAPSAWASCTAKVPTPPEAPLISTFCPRSTCRCRAAPGGRSARRSARRPLPRTRARRLARELRARARRVLRPGAEPRAEHLVARRATRRRPLADGATTRPARSVPVAGSSVAQAVPEPAEHEPGDAVPVGRVDRRRVHPHQHLVAAHGGELDLPRRPARPPRRTARRRSRHRRGRGRRQRRLPPRSAGGGGRDEITSSSFASPASGGGPPVDLQCKFHAEEA